MDILLFLPLMTKQRELSFIFRPKTVPSVRDEAPVDRWVDSLLPGPSAAVSHHICQITEASSHFHVEVYLEFRDATPDTPRTAGLPEQPSGAAWFPPHTQTVFDKAVCLFLQTPLSVTRPARWA